MKFKQQAENIPEITLYDAIRQMRDISAKGNTFSFTFASCNKESRTTDGIKEVRCARLRKAAKNDDVRNADLKIFYFDEDSQKPRVCWQHLIMFFKGQKVIV